MEEVLYYIFATRARSCTRTCRLAYTLIFMHNAKTFTHTLPIKFSVRHWDWFISTEYAEYVNNPYFCLSNLTFVDFKVKIMQSFGVTTTWIVYVPSSFSLQKMKRRTVEYIVYNLTSRWKMRHLLSHKYIYSVILTNDTCMGRGGVW